MLKWFRFLHRPIYESRQRALVHLIVPCLRASDRVLDVGCGYGALGRALMGDEACPDDVIVRGLERHPRSEQYIEIDGYEGGVLPYEDAMFDVVILADVLHHEATPDQLLAECIRVSRRLVIIKDHLIDGFLGQWRTSLIDWAANAPYGVQCLFEYKTHHDWLESHRRHGLTVERELTSINLYPPGINLIFGRGLHYFAVLSRAESG